VTIPIRRLSEHDVDILTLLAVEDGDFDIEGRNEPSEAPDPSLAREYLANPTVLFWISTDGSVITGFLQCLVLPIRTGKGRELLLYEVGVRKSYRRLGVGRALLRHMEAWMRDNNIDEMWVCADNPGAEDFYKAVGYERTAPGYFQPVYMSKELE
jgi:ribosomal protein S18 acetylase RimI-like enzyme